jgi:hypothetical protein
LSGHLNSKEAIQSAPITWRKGLQALVPGENILASLAPEAAKNLKRDLIAEVEKYNISGIQTLVLPQDYFQIIARKR